MKKIRKDAGVLSPSAAIARSPQMAAAPPPSTDAGDDDEEEEEAKKHESEVEEDIPFTDFEKSATLGSQRTI